MEHLDDEKSNFVSMVSGNHLIVTIKTTEKTENESFIVSNTMVYDLATIEKFVKITPTRNFNIEENVSDK